MRRHAKASSAAPTSSRVSGFAVLMASCIAMLALAPSAFAVKTVDRFVGGPTGTGAKAFGGVLSIPRDIAVNETGAGGVDAGDVYVADDNNQRIQVFSASGAFLFTFGRNVIADGKPGDLGDAFEKCTVAADCRGGSAGGAGDAPAGELDSPVSLAIDQDTGSVYVADRDNHRVQQFSATGAFVRTWGWGVATGASAFEVCTANCLKGMSGSGLGQFGEASVSGMGIAVTPPDGNAAAGEVYVADPANSRVQSFNLDGTSPAAFGTAGSGLGQFESNMPQQVAVDSAGTVYASDKSSGARINRYDTANEEFLAPISVPPLLEGESESTSSGLEVDPDSDGGGADVDRLYVLRFPSSGNTVVQQFDEPGLVSPPASVSQTHMPTEFGSSFPSGLGIDTTAPSKLFVSSFTGSAGQGFFVLDDDGTGSAIAASIASPTDITPTSATLNGSVDPAAGLVKYHFEYSADGVTWTALPDVGLEGSGAQPVSQSVTGLVPHTLYRVRLVASKVLGPEDVKTSTSGETLLLTAVGVPTVQTRPVHQYDDTSAWLVADINPNNQSTTYRFEWGVSTSYGNALPLPNAQAGSGGITKSFMQKLGGLKPSTTYHYRVVATNDSGTSKGADQSFTTRAAFEGFEARAYEQTTPQNKLNDIGINTVNMAALPVAADGDSVAFQTFGSLGETDWGQGIMENVGLARRTPTGWTTDPIRPEPISKASSGPSFAAFGGSDLSRQLLAVPFYGLKNVGPAGLYIQDSDADSFELLADLGEAAPQVEVSSATKDLEHVAFSTSTVLTGDPGIPAFARKAYEWTNGGIKLVSVQPNGNPFPDDSAIGSGGGFGQMQLSSRNAVSSDGNHIFFSTPASFGVTDETKIYRRDDGTSTVLVSPSKRTPPDSAGPKAKLFLDATPDQGAAGPAAVFFASREKLTNQTTNVSSDSVSLGDLYRYEVNTDTLTNISAETNDPGGAEVLGMVGRSEDGSWVYYVAEGRVVPGQGAVGKPNLYAWHDDGTASGATRFIATLGSESCDGAPDSPENSGTEAAFRVGDSCNYATSNWGRWSFRTARVTADGQTLLFQSNRPLTGYDNNGFNQIYLYESRGAGQLSCVSCNPSGAAAQADALLASTSSQGAANQDLSRALSDDGRRVFITTREALLAADSNGKLDVYEWEAGRLRLISAGTGAFDSLFYGASLSGDDAFFKTRDSLVGIDRDGGLYDVYDARVGGGIAGQNPPPPGVPCVGEACKASPVSQPGAVSPASASLSGPGNAKPGTNAPPRCRKGQRKVRRSGKVRCVKRHGNRKSTRKHG